MKVLIIPADPEQFISRGLLRKDLSGYEAVLIVRPDCAIDGVVLSLVDEYLDEGVTLPPEPEEAP